MVVSCRLSGPGTRDALTTCPVPPESGRWETPAIPGKMALQLRHRP